METQICSKCKKVLPSTSEYFHKSKDRVNGLHSICKDCRLIDRKVKYQIDKEKGKPQDYYMDNRTRHLVQAMKKRGYQHLTENELEEILLNFKDKNDDNVCPYCERIVKELDIHFDHLIPYSQGGADILTNLIPVCKYCNRSKMDDNFSEWYRNQFFYNQTNEKNIMEYFLGRELKKFYKNNKVGKKILDTGGLNGEAKELMANRK